MSDRNTGQEHPDPGWEAAIARYAVGPEGAEPSPGAVPAAERTELTRDDLRAASHACEAQGNIHNRMQNEEEHVGLINCTRGQQWHDLAVKFSAAAFRGADADAAPVPPATPGWQPIATAPKDGREIVALVSGRPYFVRWTTHGTQHAYPWWRDREGYGLTEPTHWMALPPAPDPEAP